MEILVGHSGGWGVSRDLKIDSRSDYDREKKTITRTQRVKISDFFNCIGLLEKGMAVNAVIYEDGKYKSGTYEVVNVFEGITTLDKIGEFTNYKSLLKKVKNGRNTR